MKCFHIYFYEEIRDSYITPNSPFIDDQNTPRVSQAALLLYDRAVALPNFSSAYTLLYVFPVSPSCTPEIPSVQQGLYHFPIGCPYMLSPTETIQQFYIFIKTQKVPGHRLCKSALFSEAESIKTAD